jgi:hypothetical protein
LKCTYVCYEVPPGCTVACAQLQKQEIADRGRTVCDAYSPPAGMASPLLKSLAGGACSKALSTSLNPRRSTGWQVITIVSTGSRPRPFCRCADRADQTTN